MNVQKWLEEIRTSPVKKPMPILSFPSVQLLGCTVHPNFVISSGCDIPPASRWDNIDAFFNEVETFYQNA